MQSFKSNILNQIKSIPEGKIFAFTDLVFAMEKFANVAVILSNLSKSGDLMRLEKGAYYKPKHSSLGLGILPVYQNEQINYLTKKLSGYLTGAYIYNKMGLTEQVPSIITIATAYPIRPFKFKKLFIKCVKSYVDTPNDTKTLYLVQILDALKDLKHIPGTSPKIAFDKIIYLHLSKLSNIDIEEIVYLSMCYPPRTRVVLCDMLEKTNNLDLQKQLAATICPTTRFDLSYKTN